jgi:hypothetical protein
MKYATAGFCEYFSVSPAMFVVSPALSSRLSLQLRCVLDPTNDPLLQNRFSVQASADPQLVRTQVDIH